jgi:2'-hydroxyisoflavone reductase
VDPGPAPDVDDYATAKVLCEQASEEAVGGRLLTVRAGLISGPGDGSDRFGYWVSRLALAADGDVLAPSAVDRFAQVIDVRDLAAWAIAAGRRGITGTVNAVGDEHPFGDVLSQARAVAGQTGHVVEAQPQWLVEHGVNYWAGPRSLPLWLPEDARGFSRRSNAAFRRAGGGLRSLRETLQDTLDDERVRGLARERRAGLSRQDELELLVALRSAAPRSEGEGGTVRSLPRAAVPALYDTRDDGTEVGGKQCACDVAREREQPHLGTRWEGNSTSWKAHPCASS